MSGSDIQFLILWSDALFAALLTAIVAGVVTASRRAPLRRAWRTVLSNRGAMAAALLLLGYLTVAILDSVHFRPALSQSSAGVSRGPQYSVEVLSMLDVALSGLRDSREDSYSAPLAAHAFEKHSLEGADGQLHRDYPRLRFGGAHLKDPPAERGADIARRSLRGVLGGFVIWCALMGVVGFLAGRRGGGGTRAAIAAIMRARTALAWDAFAWTLLVLCCVIGVITVLSGGYHVFGTDITGNDVLYQALKSMRISLLIGTLATLVVLPLAIAMGLCAGYFGGWVDDLIQYVYTVISSIPYVLLIAAAALVMQMRIEQHADVFDTAAARADARLVSLCVIIGAISWTSLCRLLRAESLKLRESDFVQAARCFGVRDWRIMLRHILPNAFHIVLITVVLDFSSLVLAEAVLSYVGVGVDPTTISYGTMINKARGELARDPLIWWSITAAFVFMFTLVLSANVFADAVRDAFDPRAVTVRRRRVTRPSSA